MGLYLLWPVCEYALVFQLLFRIEVTVDGDVPVLSTHISVGTLLKVGVLDGLT